MTDVAIVDGTERTFDRVPSRDPRRMNHLLSAVLLPARVQPQRSYSWAHVQLDQGREGACTGFSATTEAAARPVPVFGDPVRSAHDVEALNEVARGVYHRARQLDEWTGEDYEGSSVDGACLAGRELGWWDRWVWASGSGEAMADEVMRAIGSRGPVMVASWWRAGMGGPTWTYDGAKLGGHAFLLTRVSVKRDAVWSPNSWGGAGQGWMDRHNLALALGDEGEAAMVASRLRPKGTR